MQVAAQDIYSYYQISLGCLPPSFGYWYAISSSICHLLIIRHSAGMAQQMCLLCNYRWAMNKHECGGPGSGKWGRYVSEDGNAEEMGFLIFFFFFTSEAGTISVFFFNAACFWCGIPQLTEEIGFSISFCCLPCCFPVWCAIPGVTFGDYEQGLQHISNSLLNDGFTFR